MKSQVAKAKEESRVYVHQIEIMSDMVTLNTACGMLAAIVTKEGDITEDQVDRAMELAERLVGPYREKIDQKTEEFQLKMQEAELEVGTEPREIN